MPIHRECISGGAESGTFFQRHVESGDIHQKLRANCQRYVVSYLVHRRVRYRSAYPSVLVLHFGKNRIICILKKSEIFSL